MRSIDQIGTMAWNLYQASQKHSSYTADCVKLEDEFGEFKDAAMFNQGDDSKEEFADLLHMMLRLLCYDHRPMSEQHAQELLYAVFEQFESKYNRQMVERGWNQ